jgi:hypothetical protein
MAFIQPIEKPVQMLLQLHDFFGGGFPGIGHGR